MKKEKQKTSVEWLFNEMIRIGKQTDTEFTISKIDFDFLFKEAIELESKTLDQVYDHAFDYGVEFGKRN